MPTELAAGTLSFGASDTTKTSDVTGTVGGGLVHTLVVVLPDWTNAVTATVTIVNQYSESLYSSSALAENDTYVLKLDCPISDAMDWKVTLSGAPGGSGGNVTLRPYIQ